MLKRTLFVLVLATAGCHASAVAESPTNNAELEVQVLFTHDGCTVYRFFDVGAHYYVRCNGAPPETMSRVSCGKNCSRPEAIPTLTSQR
jgi:hypothetical protein